MVLLEKTLSTLSEHGLRVRYLKHILHLLLALREEVIGKRGGRRATVGGRVEGKVIGRIKGIYIVESSIVGKVRAGTKRRRRAEPVVDLPLVARARRAGERDSKRGLDARGISTGVGGVHGGSHHDRNECRT